MEYLIHENSHWEKTTLKCKRDNQYIYREIKNNNEKTNHFCCARSGCTWTNYFTNIQELLKENNNVLGMSTMW